MPDFFEMENSRDMWRALTIVFILLTATLSFLYFKPLLTSGNIEGLWIRGYNYTQFEAQNKAYDISKGGEWICVNIKGMNLKRMMEVCQHEVGHEIFAEKCEKNISRCLE